MKNACERGVVWCGVVRWVGGWVGYLLGGPGGGNGTHMLAHVRTFKPISTSSR